MLAFNDFVDKFNVNYDQVLYMGDDIPDIPIMRVVGVSTCPNDSATDVKEIANYVSHKNGGQGCVREIIEQVLRVQGKWEIE